MGKPGGGHAPSRALEYIKCPAPTQGSETSQYLKEKEIKRDSQSSGERNGMSPNRLDSFSRGCRAGICDSRVGRGNELESSARAGDSPVPETESDTAGT